MGKRSHEVLAFVPLGLLMALAYTLPVLANLLKSLQNEKGEYVGLKNYADVLSSYYFTDSLLFTLRIALVTTVVAMVIAIVVALALRETFAGKRIVLFLFQYNLCMPHIVAAMMMIMLLSQVGVLSSLAYRAGLTESARDFPWLVRDSRGIGVTVAFVWKYFPYIGLSVLGVLQSASPEYERQAATLGIGRWKRFFHVVLPQIIPATATASIIVFASSFGEYEIPALLGASAHRSLSVMVYMKYCDMSTRDLPAAYAMMTMMTLVLMAFIISYYLLTTRKRGDRR